MKYAHYTIGRHKDENGEPLIVVDGSIFGTVDDVKQSIATFEAQFEGRGRIGDGLVAACTPATIADVHQAIADYDRARRRRCEGGGRVY